MPSLSDYESHVRQLCLARAPDPRDVDALGGESWRWLRYRRMVRRRFEETLEHQFPRSFAGIGEETFGAIVERFLAASPPRSAVLRDVGGEFADFFLRATFFALPPYARDLVRLDWAERAVGYELDDDASDRIVELVMDRPAVLCRAHRLLRLVHAVHRWDSNAEAPPRAEPAALCIYRERDTHEVRVLKMSGAGMALLEEIALGERTLVDAIRTAAERSDGTLDLDFARATGALLVELTSRGLLLGSRASVSKDESP
ncbi:MAG TPA: putative DNA-binding domain-containing protein [Polyangiaceae bacterium]|nr:putative DNA-binding domain-containing protein [Polyangiaceae bacterium]